jgi:hypothetical protein
MTQDVFSQPGTVYLLHPDREVLEQDRAEIRQLEKNGIYLECQPINEKKKESNSKPEKAGLFSASATVTSSTSSEPAIKIPSKL